VKRKLIIAAALALMLGLPQIIYRFDGKNASPRYDSEIHHGASEEEGRPLPDDIRADSVVLEKDKRTLSLYYGGELLKSYRVALGGNPVGHKQEEGDGRTPEGRYVVDFRKRDSSFHRALHISYPNSEDKRRAEERSVSPGGDIMIHGLPNGMGAVGKSHLARDWTLGCVAVTNGEIEEIWRAVPDGTPIEILP
jgi:murein L,D-transpeptidase YafK